MIVALAIARRLWPLAALVAVLLALWAWGNHRKAQGVATERAAWEAESARLRAVAAQESLQRQLAVNRADDAARAAGAAMGALAVQSKEHAHAYYRDRPVVRCLEPERVRAIAQADAAAVAATGPAK